MNKWIGIGNLTADPEMRYTDAGTQVTSFSVAINNGRDRQGEERPPTYIDVVTWEKLAENCAEYLRKGSKVAVEGFITVEKWEDKEGNKRQRYRIRAMNVEFLTPKSEREGQSTPPRQQRPEHAPARDEFDNLPW